MSKFQRCLLQSPILRRQSSHLEAVHYSSHLLFRCILPIPMPRSIPAFSILYSCCPVCHHHHHSSLEFSHTHLEIVAIVAGSCGKSESVSYDVLLQLQCQYQLHLQTCELGGLLPVRLCCIPPSGHRMPGAILDHLGQKVEGFLEGRLICIVT